MMLFLFVIMMFSGCSDSASVTQSMDEIIVENGTMNKPDAGLIKQQGDTAYRSVAEIPVPEGYKRVSCDSASFGHFLRFQPLKTENNIVYLYNGEKKWNQDAQFAVLKMDVGKQDLQQCADAVMRLRGEYLYESKQYNKIHFNFLSDGKPRYYTEYSANDRTYKKFRSYMNYIFSYANTASLSKELVSVDISEIMPGDVFIMTGNPYGHAVTVMDVAVKAESGKKIFLLSQSYMPAQDIHILKNPSDDNLSPWYEAESESMLITPEWTFSMQNLKRFKE